MKKEFWNGGGGESEGGEEKERNSIEGGL